MLRRAVLHRDSFRRSRGTTHERSSRFNPEAPLGDLPKIVEKMTAGDVDSVLRLIAQQARLVTAASGAAIALGAKQQYFCRASAGDIAPPVGIPIRSDSGLTGECIRRRVTLRCDDSEKDNRVDAAACRELQVRSIAVVPIRAGEELAGVLEVFSHHISAFTNAHLATLERIAALIADVCQRAAELIVAAADVPPTNVVEASGAGSLTAHTAVESPSAMESLAKRAAGIGTRISEYASVAFAWCRAQFAVVRRVPRQWLVVGAAAVLIVVSLTLILGRRSSAPNVQESQAATETAPAPTSAASQEPASLPNAPSAESTAPVAAPAATAPSVTSAPAKSSKPKAAIQPPAQPAEDEVVVLKVASGNRASAPAQKSAETESAPPTLDSLSALGSSPGPGILAASVATPKLADRPAAVSQGVIAGKLIKRVNPAYPLPAREARLQGQVVLGVMVQKNGKVGKVRIISGHPMLAQAAVQAVKQWVYEPFRLNGQAVDAEAQVTINFKE